jgi:2-methylcitrate dehydratase PrpD
MDIMEKMAKHVLDTKYEDLPEEAVDAVKKGTLDIIGCMIGGASEARIEVDLVKEWGGKPEGPIYIYGGKVPLANAAFANSCIAYAIDYDASVVFHDLTSTVPTALTVGDFRGGISGKEFITTVAAGEDLAIRLGLSGPYSNFGSFCPAGTVVVFATAAIASRILGLDLKGMMNALGLAFGRSGTTHAPASDKVSAVRLQMGFATRNGIESAILAQKGIHGIKNILQGQHGWYNVYPMDKAKIDLNTLTDQLGKRYEIARLHKKGLKLHGACGTTFPPSEAAMSLVRKHQIEPKKIRRITVETSLHYNTITGHPLTFGMGDVPDRAEAQFSQPYMVANRIIRGCTKLEHFTLKYMLDPEVIDLANKVVPVAAKDLEGKSTRVEIEMNDGKKYSRYMKDTEIPFRPLDQVKEKYREMIATAPDALPAANCERIIELVDRLETLDNISELTKLLVRD